MCALSIFIIIIVIFDVSIITIHFFSVYNKLRRLKCFVFFSSLLPLNYTLLIIINKCTSYRFINHLNVRNSVHSIYKAYKMI